MLTVEARSQRFSPGAQKFPFEPLENGWGVPRRPLCDSRQRNCSFCLSKNGRGYPPSIPQSTRCCGWRAQAAFEVSICAEQARVCMSLCRHGRPSRRPIHPASNEARESVFAKRRAGITPSLTDARVMDDRSLALGLRDRAIPGAGHDGLECANNTLMRGSVRPFRRWGGIYFSRLNRNGFWCAQWGMAAVREQIRTTSRPAIRPRLTVAFDTLLYSPDPINERRIEESDLSRPQD
jgi:hypothetical protein